ncbi:MAG TPA: MlaD family protein [Solirubrobacteraceae bacterium]|jgi:virulence factor Mce-like protein|nr:MlaD family protein [Solirubrobacteraceae bacterium]
MNAKREVNRLWLGGITLLIFLGIVLGVMAGAIGPQMFSGGGRKVTAVFANVEQLIAGDEVRVDGVYEGTVSSIKLDPGGRSTSVTMTVFGSAGPLYRDATATIAWKTVLGGAFNVDLTRGNVAAGPLGSNTIPVSRTTNQVELDDLLSFDQGSAKAGLQRMFGELATALSQPQPPSRLLGTLAAVSPAVTTGIGALRGQVQDSDLRNLVTGAASTVQALDAPNGQLRSLVQGAAATVAVTAARAGDIQAALDEATPAMDQTKTTFAQLRTTLALANPLLRSLSGSVGQVAPTVEQLYPTVVGARNLLNTAVPLLHALPPTLRSLASTSRQGVPLLQTVTPSLDRLENTVLPYLNTVDPSSNHTTAEMIGPTAEALGPDIAGQEDQNGHFIRFPATAGSSPLYLPCQIYAGNPTTNQLLACESLQSLLSSFVNYNPLSNIPLIKSAAKR